MPPGVNEQRSSLPTQTSNDSAGRYMLFNKLGRFRYIRGPRLLGPKCAAQSVPKAVPKATLCRKLATVVSFGRAGRRGEKPGRRGESPGPLVPLHDDPSSNYSRVKDRTEHHLCGHAHRKDRR